jgi:uncharacterized membrane protein YbhN (UPF0104 family)
MEIGPVVEEDRPAGAEAVPLTPEPSAPAPSLWGWQTALSLAATATVLGWMVRQVDFAAVAADLQACNPWLVLLGGACHYGTYPVRGLRWKRVLGSTPHSTPAGQFGLAVFFYSFVDNVVPGKMGDLYAAHLARINFGVRRSAALGSIFFIRMIDAWIVLALAALASVVLFSAHLPSGVGWGLVGGLGLAVAATGALLVFRVLHRFMPNWLPAAAREMIAAFRSRMWPARRDLPAIAALTALIWGLETLWIFFLVNAFGFTFSLAGTLFLTHVSLLATAFPFTPSGAGAVEATLYGCLRLLEVSHPLAVSVTVINRLIDYWLHFVLGVIAWGLRRRIGLRTWMEGPGGAPRKWIGFGKREDEKGRTW